MEVIRIGGGQWNLGEVSIAIPRGIGERQRKFKGDVDVRLECLQARAWNSAGRGERRARSGSEMTN